MRRLVLALAHIVLVIIALADVIAAQDTQTAEDTSSVEADEPPPLAALPQLAADLTAIKVRIDEVEANLAAAAPESQAVFTFQRRRRWTEHHDVLGRLVAGIEREQGTAVEAYLVTAVAGGALRRELVTIEAWLAEVSAEAVAMRRALTVASPTDFVQTEIELSRLRGDIDGLFVAFNEDYERAVVLGIDLGAERSLHEAALVERTELLGATLELALEEQTDYQDWITKQGVDTVATGYRIAATEERVLGVTASLQEMVALMAASDLEVSDYRRLIVTATGDIGTEVLDVQVVGGLIAQWSGSVAAWFESNFDVLVLRAIIIVVLLLLAGQLSRLVRTVARRVLSSRRVDLSSLVRNLVISGLSKTVWVVAFFVTLSVLGIDLAPMLAGLGIAGFVIGFALQDTLSNFASGLMIMVYRPFDVGDWITAGGVSGEVKDLTLVSTVVLAVDNKRITIPNGKVWSDVINNATAEDIRRVDLVFSVSHSGDVDEGMSVLREILANEERVLEDPEPLVKVKKVGEFSVDLLCAPWCKTEDYWGLYWDLNRLVKKRFDAEGVSFPSASFFALGED